MKYKLLDIILTFLAAYGLIALALDILHITGIL